MPCSSFARSYFNLDVDFQSIATIQLLQGLGVALFFMPVLTILLSDLEGHEIAAGSGLATFLRTLGGSFSASFTTYLWSHRAVIHHAHLTEAISPYSPTTQAAVQQLGQGDAQRAAALLDRMITQQAYQISFNEICHGLGYLFLGLILVLWLAKAPFHKEAKTETAGAH